MPVIQVYINVMEILQVRTGTQLLPIFRHNAEI